MTVVLPARLEQDLDWKVPELVGPILWQVDFGLETGEVPLDDEAAFRSYGIALDHFVEVIWKRYREQTAGICLYAGKPDVVWILGDGPAGIDALAEYLHRLASFLPDELAVFCRFDVSHLSSPGKIAQLLSKERFAHLELKVEGTALFSTPRASVGICLPLIEYFDASVEQGLDVLIEELQKKGLLFRMIPEAFLTEEWNELEMLYVLKDALSPLGKRKLLGFCAAGGEVRYVEKIAEGSDALV